jgi:hypothetical protein
MDDLTTLMTGRGVYGMEVRTNSSLPLGTVLDAGSRIVCHPLDAIALMHPNALDRLAASCTWTRDEIDRRFAMLDDRIRTGRL